MGLSPHAAYCRAIGAYNNTTDLDASKRKFTQRPGRKKEQFVFRHTEIAQLISIHNHIIENNNLAMTYHRTSRAEALFAASLLLSMVRISDVNLPSIKKTTKTTRPMRFSENTLARQSLAAESLSQESGWLPAAIRQWLPTISDPLRFPAAEAVELTTSIPSSPGENLHGDHYGTSTVESDTAIRQYAAELFSRYAGYADSSIEDDLFHLVNSAIKAIRNDPDVTMALAELLNPLLFNYKHNETDAKQITEPALIINGWLEQEIFDGSVFDFVIRNAIENRSDNHYDFNTIKSALVKQISKSLNINPDSAYTHTKNYIFDNIVVQKFPKCDESHATLWGPDSTNWGISHAGLSFAALLGVDIKDINNDEAHAIGVMIYNLFYEDGDISRLVGLFSLPAILSYMHDHPEKVQNWTPETRQQIEETALNDYFEKHSQSVFENNPQVILKQSIENFKSRIELLEDGREYNKENLDKSFYQQNQEIADKFHVVDKILISMGFADIAESEREFIDSSEITFGKFALVRIWETNKHSGVFPALSHDKNRLTIIDNPPNIDIFQARNGDNSRIYALYGINGRYQVVRVDHELAKYYDLLPENDKDVPIDGFTVELVYNQNDNIPATQWIIDRLIQRLANHHKDIFKKQLDLVGYDNTFMEKAQDVLLSLVPFYNCFTAMAKNEGGEALFSCGLDVFSLFPVIGQASKVSASAGRVLGQGMQFAGKNALSKTSAAQGAGHMAKVALSHFYQAGVIPVSKILTRKQFLALAFEAFRGLEPGLLLLYTPSKTLCRRALRMGRSMEAVIPHLDRALAKLNQLKPGGAKTQGLSRTDPLVIPNSNRQAVVMRMEAGGSSDKMPSITLDELQPFVWQRFSEFMPLYRHGSLPAAEIRKMLNDLLGRDFRDKPFLVVKGLDAGPHSFRYPYLQDAQQITALTLDYCFKEIKKANNFLKAALRKPAKIQFINKYFAKEIGIPYVAGNDITRQMINATDEIINRILSMENKIKNNIHFASTKRTPDAEGHYPSSLTDQQMKNGPSAFCLAGDSENRLYIIVDRFIAGQLQPEALTHVLTHELTHLAAHTEDIFYLDNIILSAIGKGDLLRIFEKRIETKSMNLVNLKLKVQHHLKLPPTTRISDDVIYAALRDDPVFKANVMMLNADNVVKFIQDIAKMERGVRTTRSAQSEEQQYKLIYPALMQLLVKISLNQDLTTSGT
jgi:hypothetical protein